jgi:hypothetical protein
MCEDCYPPEPMAEWNTNLKYWSKQEADLFSTRSVLFSGTWPTSGTTRNGKVYAPRTPAHPTSDSGSSLLPIPEEAMLRTPAVTDSTGGAISEKQARERNRMLKIADQAVTLAFENGLPVSESIAKSLLPTPTTGSSQRNSRGAVTHPTKPSGVQLEQAIELAQGILPREFESWDEVGASYLPTPAARDGKDGTGERIRDGVVQTDSIARAVLSSGQITLLGTPRTSSSNGSTAKERANGALKGRLEDQVDGAKEGSIDWGKYEPAIRRWEAVVGRPSPDPTNPDGRDGAHRLSSRFTEWMMGLPEGWITSHGLSRVAELKLAGNGVVPQQAALALATLLEGINLDD